MAGVTSAEVVASRARAASATVDRRARPSAVVWHVKTFGELCGAPYLWVCSETRMPTATRPAPTTANHVLLFEQGLPRHVVLSRTAGRYQKTDDGDKSGCLLFSLSKQSRFWSLPDRRKSLQQWWLNTKTPSGRIPGVGRQLINSVIRKFTRNRKIYPNEDSALKLIYMAIREASQRWTMPVRHWKEALNHFAIMFEGRLPELTSK